jgi:hypothetical protein
MSDLSQLELDLDGGVELREEGMAQAATNRQEMLELSRDVAEEIARSNGVVTSDDVRYRLNLAPSNNLCSQNWMGSMFRDPRFTWTGDYVNSKIRRNHARPIRVWRLAR